MLNDRVFSLFLDKPVDWMVSQNYTWMDWLNESFSSQESLVENIRKNRSSLAQALSLINENVVLYYRNKTTINEYEFENTLVSIIQYISSLESVDD